MSDSDSDSGPPPPPFSRVQRVKFFQAASAGDTARVLAMIADGVPRADAHTAYWRALSAGHAGTASRIAHLFGPFEE